MVAISFLFISPTMIPNAASTIQTPLTAMPNQRLAQNNAGIIILENATVIDGTGDLPKPNTTIVINGSRIADLSNNATVNSDLPFAAKNVINLTGKYIIPGLFDMHAHVANVLKNSYNQSESEDMLSMLLAYGITTIRNTGGPTEQSVALKIFLKEKLSAPKFLQQDNCLTLRKSPFRLWKNR
jgi:hypothetical protein